MSNELQVFSYTEAHQIRTTVIDGEPWFVAKDICDVLGLADVTSALRTLDDDEKLVRKISGAGQIRKMATISEPELYKLIMRSSKPEAKQFTRWVIHEVLPSIHKSGMYLADQAADAYVHNPEEFAKMAARCSALEHRVAEMEQVLNKRYSLSVLGENGASANRSNQLQGRSFVFEPARSTYRAESLVQVLQGKEIALLAEKPPVEQTDSEGNRCWVVQPANLRRVQHYNADNAARAAISDGRTDSREISAVSNAGGRQR